MPREYISLICCQTRINAVPSPGGVHNGSRRWKRRANGSTEDAACCGKHRLTPCLAQPASPEVASCRFAVLC